MKDNLFRVTEIDALTTCRIKFYWDKNGELYPVQKLTCNEKVFRNPAFEKDIDKVLIFRDSDDDNETSVTSETKCSESAIRRAKKMIYDLIRCNPMVWFCTLTFNGELLDRTDYTEVIRKFNQWSDNRVRRKGYMYVAVIERHKESEGLHFHVVCNDALSLVDSGTVKCVGRKRPIRVATADRYGIPETDRKTVYNITDWSYGFSTAIQITGDDKGLKVASYLRKYLTKDFEKIGGRYYYSGGDLKRPVYKYVDDDYGDCEYDYEFTVAGKAYRVLMLERGE